MNAKADTLSRADKWVNFIRDNIALALLLIGLVATVAVWQFSVNQDIAGIKKVQAQQQEQLDAQPNSEVINLKLSSIEKKLDEKADQNQVTNLEQTTQRIDTSVQKLLDLMIAHLDEKN